MCVPSLGILKGDLELQGGSDACRGTLHGAEVGRMKHVEVKQMLFEGHVASASVDFRLVPREQDTGDAVTHWSAEAANQTLRRHRSRGF